ncbi:hypothetical protein [Nocardioides sp.]|uniref:hypothetical protein n=1 Tax=Nocardioides sp. TaxID=35761 RepID=UPI00260FF9C2|nr:hypothetical protein [Nocardioides sp.]
MKSLTDLMSEQSTGRPRTTRRTAVGKGQDYVVEAGLLIEQLQQTRAQAGPKPIGGTVQSPEETELRARLGEVTDLMAEYEADLTIEATRSDGDWVQWRLKHPARDQDQPGYDDDIEITQGYCNSEALIEDLERYVVAYEGEPIVPGAFAALNLQRPSKKVLAGLVVGLYERQDIPKFRLGLAAILADVDA